VRAVRVLGRWKQGKHESESEEGDEEDWEERVEGVDDEEREEDVHVSWHMSFIGDCCNCCGDVDLLRLDGTEVPQAFVDMLAQHEEWF
jgi:hypothetical protein